MNRDSYSLRGLLATGSVHFAAEKRGNPLEEFPSLRRGGRPFNLWLAEELLEPGLERWSGRTWSRFELGATVAADVEEATERSLAAFRSLANTLAAPSDQALLAAAGVTANLQRTFALLGEFMLGDGPGLGAEFSLSRLWCGFIDYADNTGFFSMDVAPTTDPGYLRNALRCSTREIEPRCADGLQRLREHIRLAGQFGPQDLRHLLSASIAPRSGTDAQPEGLNHENRSGVVRPRNSSM